ncbi:ABC transporter substrate-binding protein [Mesorhizobium sp.]|uniref:ABC transporter substrate-binding protein n=2 Tax=unclassified Mesorhizobium TaxID=325217 RepID=UPI000FE764BF|nr:ABC transporter substrate-binding protein [Mesorhizobium sp.]RWK49950.1 MAG: ABC transporter substrate-binding protein [Mesorhizobium sp.]TIM85473.1 MAG: ABC transporter substrate-binding protein [Mesorhizobium sp.]TIP41484.1 MAG: ABC transporter substrate-binding protein [Mesorhizobium sp.]
MEINTAERLVKKGRMSRRDFIQIAIAAGLSAGAANLTFTSYARAEPKKGGRLRVGLAHGSSTDSLDPATYLDYYMGTVGWGALGNGLTSFDETGNVKPDLAESLEPSNKAARWAFKLRKGTEFHNGKSVAAEDIVASIRHHMGDGSKSPVKALLAQISELKADGDTVVFTLAAGNADFPYLLSDYHLPIMPMGENGQADWASGIRTGAYVLNKFVPGVNASMTRNPNYHGTAWFDEVEVLSILDPVARQNALATGEIDYMDRVDVKTLRFLERNEELEIDQVSGYGHYTFPMNVTAAPFNNSDVRKALKYAVDRQEIINKILGGVGDAGNDNPIARNIKYAIDPMPAHTYDPEKAKSLLAKAGFSNLKLELSASDAAFTGAVDAALLFKNSAEKAGIEINVIREPADAYWDNVWLKKPFIASFWHGRPTVDWFLTYAYAAESNQNETFWKNPRFNELLVEGRSELDDKKRAEIYAEAQQLLHDDGGQIVLAFPRYVSAHSKKVAHGDLIPGWDVDGMKIAERWWASN